MQTDRHGDPKQRRPDERPGRRYDVRLIVRLGVFFLGTIRIRKGLVCVHCSLL